MEIAEIKVAYHSNSQQTTKINNSKESYDLFIANWNLETIELQEEFKVILLNRNNKVLGIYHLSKGGVSATVVDPKLVFSVALKCNASSIILGHNHPSGSLLISKADKVLTQRLKKAGEYLDINVLDHLVISKEKYTSFADEGLL